MYCPVLMMLVLGLGMFMMLMLTACGGGGSSVQEEKEVNKVHILPEDPQTYEGQPLPIGSYLTEEFKPAMSLRIEKGWTRGGTELSDAWDLQDIENDAFWLGF